MSESVSPQLLVRAYTAGIFPMAIPDEGEAIYWFSPDPRAIIPLDAYRIPRSVRRAVRKSPFATTTDTRFVEVIRACSARAQTWISDEIIRLYTELFRMGFAHSVETWLDGRLVGGLYGVAVGGAFFGESMYHTVADASNVALADLIARLLSSRFLLLDTQYLTPHLERFGAVEISREAYLQRLEEAIESTTSWNTATGPRLPSELSARHET